MTGIAPFFCFLTDLLWHKFTDLSVEIKNDKAATIEYNRGPDYSLRFWSYYIRSSTV